MPQGSRTFWQSLFYLQDVPPAIVPEVLTQLAQLAAFDTTELTWNRFCPHPADGDGSLHIRSCNGESESSLLFTKVRTTSKTYLSNEVKSMRFYKISKAFCF